MRYHPATLITLLLIFMVHVQLHAHHSVGSTFDKSKAMTIQGVITKVEWQNPHVWISMDVKNADGAIASWQVQIAAPSSLYRDGMRKEQIDLTKTYSMEIWPAFDGSKHANGRTLVFPDGQTFDVSDKWPEFPPANPPANPKVKYK